MSEHDRTAPQAAPDEEADVRRLIEQAGPRPPVPAEDLEAITAAARAAWRRDVASREEARESLAGYQGTVAPAAPTAPVPAARDRASGATAPAAASPPRRHRGRSEIAKQWLFAAAVLLGIGLLGWLMRAVGEVPAGAAVESVSGTTWIGTAATGGSRPLLPGEEIPVGTTLATARPGSEVVAGRASLRLPGGTVVRVDAGTTVRLDSPTALTLERGAVYADSGESGSGLTVATPGGTATDVGTRFSVRVLDPGPRPKVEVRVRDGAVAVERGGRSWMASAGEELVVATLHGEPHRRPVDAWGAEWDWVLDAAAGYPIEGRTLGELLDWVARETGWTVRWADPALAGSARDVVLRGSAGRLRPDQVPFAVLPGAGLEGELVESDGGSELVIRRRQNS